MSSISHTQYYNTEDASAFCVFVPIIHRKVNMEQMNVIMIHVGLPVHVDWVELNPSNEHFRSAFVHFDRGNPPLMTIDTKDTIWYSVVHDDGTVQEYWLDMVLAEKPRPMPDIHQMAHQIKMLEESLWGSIHRKDEQIRDLEDSVEHMQRQLTRQSILLQRYIPSVPLSVPLPLKLERQTAQTGFVSDVSMGLLPHHNDDRNSVNESMHIIRHYEEEDELMDLMSLSTHNSIPDLVSLSTHDSIA